jgi:hypothetical protein
LERGDLVGRGVPADDGDLAGLSAPARTSSPQTTLLNIGSQTAVIAVGVVGDARLGCDGRLLPVLTTLAIRSILFNV